MLVCLAAGIKLTVIAANAFTLAWTHTVEKTGWQEDWRLEHGRLVLEAARVKGSGAGMEPPDDAVLANGWWIYKPKGISLDRLRLANNGGPAGLWRVCVEGKCQEIGGGGDDSLEIAPCETPDR